MITEGTLSHCSRNKNGSELQKLHKKNQNRYNKSSTYICTYKAVIGLKYRETVWIAVITNMYG